MKIQLIVLFLLCSSFTISDICIGGVNNEIPCDNAIRIAKDLAKVKKYDTSNADIEILKVKRGLERGPVRLVWLMRSFPMKNNEVLFTKEFWVVYFYPKGQLENPSILGGDFCTLIDLYSGEVIDFFEGQ